MIYNRYMIDHIRYDMMHTLRRVDSLTQSVGQSVRSVKLLYNEIYFKIYTRKLS